MSNNLGFDPSSFFYTSGNIVPTGDARNYFLTGGDLLTVDEQKKFASPYSSGPSAPSGFGGPAGGFGAPSGGGTGFSVPGGFTAPGGFGGSTAGPASTTNRSPRAIFSVARMTSSSFLAPPKTISFSPMLEPGMPLHPMPAVP